MLIQQQNIYLRRTNKNLVRAFESSLDAIRAREAAIKTLEAEVEDLQGQNTNLQSDLDYKKSQTTALRAELNEREDEIEDLQKCHARQVSHLHLAAIKSRNEMEETLSTIADYERLYRQERDRNSELGAEVNSLRTSLCDVSKRLCDVSKRNDNITAAYDTLRSEACDPDTLAMWRTEAEGFKQAFETEREERREEVRLLNEEVKLWKSAARNRWTEG
jgi:chromosome segregation ATPase